MFSKGPYLSSKFNKNAFNFKVAHMTKMNILDF